jgi:hypothetical protein
MKPTKRQNIAFAVIGAFIGITVSISSTEQSVIAFKVTATSYQDGFNKGFADARCDRVFCHGHGFDPSCPRGHTAVYCNGYAAGYRNGWNSGPRPTSTSYQDGFNKGFADARCDRVFCHGHGFDPSCPRGHTAVYCNGYAAGYRNGWRST